MDEEHYFRNLQIEMTSKCLPNVGKMFVSCVQPGQRNVRLDVRRVQPGQLVVLCIQPGQCDVPCVKPGQCDVPRVQPGQAAVPCVQSRNVEKIPTRPE